jgi:hypothetical protein
MKPAPPTPGQPPQQLSPWLLAAAAALVLALAWISGLDQRCQGCGKRVGAAACNHQIAGSIGN